MLWELSKLLYIITAQRMLITYTSIVHMTQASFLSANTHPGLFALLYIK